MADINPTLPSVNELNSTADPKVLSALQTIVSTVNDLETANLADSAVTSAKIATGAVTTTQILDGTIATADIANAAITSAKLASGVGGTALVVGSVSATGTVTTTSAGYVDVTSASFSLTVAANSVTIVSVSCELKGSAMFIYGGVNALIGSSAYIIDIDKFTAGPDGTGLAGLVHDTTFGKISASAGIHSSQSGTGAQTVKARFAQVGGGTASIKNVYLSAVNIPL